MSKLNDLIFFYDLMSKLEIKVGGKRTLEKCDSSMNWPKRGVYFFFEPGEYRTQTGNGLRVVRVGTHALKPCSRTVLWQRLRQHKGTISDGGGNHRGSIFRLHIGSAFIQKEGWTGMETESWGKGSTASREIRQCEKPLEQAVSQYIRKMPFLWLEVNDQPGPESLRGIIERNSIALLSDFCSKTSPIDPPNNSWLGRWAKNYKVKESGLWNSDHVVEVYDPAFLRVIEGLLNTANQQS